MPTITINATGPQAARVAHAVGVRLGLETSPGVPRDATLGEVQKHIRDLLKNLVIGVERQEQAITPPDIIPPDLT